MQSSNVPTDLAGLHVAVVGGGRLGTALSRALRAAGCDVSGPHGRGFDGRHADLVLLCVGDDDIASAAALIRSGPLVGHCSGASTLDVLAPHERLSIHPLLSIAGGSAVEFGGAACAVAGSTPRALGIATSLACALGMTPLRVAESARALYHAAATVASNYLVSLEAAAARLAAEAGLEREHLIPLVRSTVDNWAKLGAERALTGPVVRGDESTVARQRAAVVAAAPDLAGLWDALTDVTRRLAARAAER